VSHSKLKMLIGKKFVTALVKPSISIIRKITMSTSFWKSLMPLLAVLVVPFAIAASGAILWITFTGGEINSSPTVVNDTVYVGSNDGYVYAMDASTGEVLWATDTGAPVDLPAKCCGLPIQVHR
jgi:outer membrane protein assembly factor BamB